MHLQVFHVGLVLLFRILEPQNPRQLPGFRAQLHALWPLLMSVDAHDSNELIKRHERGLGYPFKKKGQYAHAKAARSLENLIISRRSGKCFFFRFA